MLRRPTVSPEGKLIVFEGIDGCGKSTQIKILADFLDRRGIDFVSTRQPTSAYRDAPEVRAYLDRGDQSVGMEVLCRLAAEDRKRHLESVILPSLREGRWVLSDRYVYSSYAFFPARGVDIETVRLLNRGVRVPDLTLLLDLDPLESRVRVLARDGEITKHEERDVEFMRLVRENYFESRDQSFAQIDASRCTDTVAMQIQSTLNRIMPELESMPESREGER